MRGAQRSIATYLSVLILVLVFVVSLVWPETFGFEGPIQREQHDVSAALVAALQQAGQPKPQNFQTRSHINNAGGDLDRYNEPQIF